jgi:type 1 glutamine amidotransferase
MKTFSIAFLSLILFVSQTYCQQAPIRVLVFSKTVGFRHESINNGLKVLWEMARKHNWNITATEDAGYFNDDFLKPFDVVVWLNTTGDVLDTRQEEAFMRWYRQGKGYVGLHSATDTEYDWAWYGQLIAGAYFKSHPATQEGTLIVENTAHPSMEEFRKQNMKTWTVIDEWYTFRASPRDKVNVLLALDESSVKDKNADMVMGDHPIAWWHHFDGGRAFYTERGHTPESFDEALFQSHLRGAIEWAAGRAK